MYNIAIDGPSGSGKSTVAKEIAKKLNFIYVDTGAMYRAIALYYINNNIDIENEELVNSKLNNISIEIEYINGMQTIFLNEEDVSNKIRNELVALTASKISIFSKVRKKLLDLQRNLAKNNNVVMDGRDIGSFVLPFAQLKIYLSASSTIRAKRRFDELILNGASVDFEDIKNDIENRDYRDMHRKIAPLKRLDDAIYIDSSNLTIDEVVEKIIKLKGENEKNNKG